MVSSTKVRVKQGTVAGGEGILPNGKPYNFFQGIPYAVPPLGELRFKAPVPLERFSTPEIDCTKERSVAFQMDGSTGVGSEDCLFLNVYTPQNKVDSSMPVMVFVHGGSFEYGSGNSDFYNPLYLIQEDVVVVTMNYRLGPLGFLSLPEANIPGNAGLKDQRLALQWVQENISQFNGDPGNVTLFGESAGSGCVHLHVLSKNSRKFFHKAICQSGLGNMPLFTEDEGQGTLKTKKMAKSLGCTSDNPMEIAKFLQHFPDLTEMIKPLTTTEITNDIFAGRPIPARPVIEIESPEAVMTKAPIESLNDENSIDIPVMMGYNSAEGIVLLPYFLDKLEHLYNNPREFIPKSINLQPDDPRREELASALKNFYFHGEPYNEKKLDSFSDVLGDLFFIIDANVAAEIHSRKQQKSPLFFYRFDYVGALNIYKKIFTMENVKGASHADELSYLFQATIAPEPWEEQDKRMVKIMCKLWTNFAKFSNPTPRRENRFVDCTWQPVRKICDKENFTLNAFVIDEHQRMVENPNKDRMDFWRNAQKTYNKNV